MFLKSQGQSRIVERHDFLSQFVGLKKTPQHRTVLHDLAWKNEVVCLIFESSNLPCLFQVIGVKKASIVYVESICRVETLSMSGRILYYFADQFVVQWPQLAEKYPRSTYLGRVVWNIQKNILFCLSSKSSAGRWSPPTEAEILICHVGAVLVFFPFFGSFVLVVPKDFDLISSHFSDLFSWILF